MRFWGVCIFMCFYLLSEQLSLSLPQSVTTSVLWTKGEEILDVKDASLYLSDENIRLEKTQEKNLVSKDGNVPSINDDDIVLNLEKHVTAPSRGGQWGSFFRAFIIVVASMVGLLFVSSVLRKNHLKSAGGLLEVLDVLHLDSRHEIISLRWGERIVLIAKSGDGFILLSELSDEEDVCRYLKKHDFLNAQGSSRKIDLSKHFLSMIREKFNR